MSLFLRKTSRLLFTAAAVTLLLSGCGKKETVTLTVWTPGEDIDVVTDAVEDFKQMYKDEAEFDVLVLREDIAGAKKIIINGNEDIADVYRFADDQLYDIVNAGGLLPITEGREEIIEQNGGADSPIVKSGMRDGQLYGCPATASNGYFLIYNTSILSPEDVESLDKMLEKCDSEDASVLMDFSSGWYTYSFFGAAGMTAGVSEDGTHNVCDFNREDGIYKGIDVVDSLLKVLSEHNSLLNVANGEMCEYARNNKVAAIVSGTWHYGELDEIWGGNISASKLPTFNINGTQEQMKSFCGYSYYGVSGKTAQPEWSQKLAAYLSDYDIQMKRFLVTGDCPTNIKAADSEEVKSSPVISAFFEQSQHAITQNVLEPYWTPMSILGTCIAAGNPDNIDMEVFLDQTVEEITK